MHGTGCDSFNHSLGGISSHYLWQPILHRLKAKQTIHYMQIYTQTYDSLIFPSLPSPPLKEKSFVEDWLLWLTPFYYNSFQQYFDM